MSNYVKSTNFAIKDNLVTTDPAKVIKGIDIDNEYNAISNAIASKADTNSPALTGTPTAPTATLGSNTTQLANTSFVAASMSALIPAGIITLWSGAISAIPSGWVLCNGSNSTPDLRDRFVVGAGTTYAVGATGGSASVTLDTTMIPSHTHTFTTGAENTGHTHFFSATSGGTSNDHVHGLPATEHAHGTGGGPNTSNSTSASAVNGGAMLAATGGIQLFYTNDGTPYTSWGGGLTNNASIGISATTGQNAGHTHSVSGSTGDISNNHNHSGTTAATGGALAHENRPPYYALAYIMKT